MAPLQAQSQAQGQASLPTPVLPACGIDASEGTGGSIAERPNLKVSSPNGPSHRLPPPSDPCLTLGKVLDFSNSFDDAHPRTEGGQPLATGVAHVILPREGAPPPRATVPVTLGTGKWRWQVEAPTRAPKCRSRSPSYPTSARGPHTAVCALPYWPLPSGVGGRDTGGVDVQRVTDSQTLGQPVSSPEPTLAQGPPQRVGRGPEEGDQERGGREDDGHGGGSGVHGGQRQPQARELSDPIVATEDRDARATVPLTASGCGSDAEPPQAVPVPAPAPAPAPARVPMAAVAGLGHGSSNPASPARGTTSFQQVAAGPGSLPWTPDGAPPRVGSQRPGLQRLVASAVEYRAMAAQLRHTSQAHHVRAVEEVALLARDVQANMSACSAGGRVQAGAPAPAGAATAVPASTSSAAAASIATSKGKRTPLAWSSPAAGRASGIPTSTSASAPLALRRPAWEASSPTGSDWVTSAGGDASASVGPQVVPGPLGRPAAPGGDHDTTPLLGRPLSVVEPVPGAALGPALGPALVCLGAKARGPGSGQRPSQALWSGDATMGHDGPNEGEATGGGAGRGLAEPLPTPSPAPGPSRGHDGGGTTLPDRNALEFARQAALQAAYRQRHTGYGPGAKYTAVGPALGMAGDMEDAELWTPAAPLPGTPAVIGISTVPWTSGLGHRAAARHRMSHVAGTTSGSGSQAGLKVGLEGWLTPAGAQRPPAVLPQSRHWQPEALRVPESLLTGTGSVGARTT
jgi:hypothetical protein